MSRRIPIGIKTSPQAVDWSTLDATWQRIGMHDVFESVWMKDLDGIVRTDGPWDVAGLADALDQL